MRNVISQIENAVDMVEVEEIMSEFYSYSFVQGQLSMVEVDSGREGLQPKIDLSDVHHSNLIETEDKTQLSLSQGLDSNLKIPETEAHATGFKSPKMAKWDEQTDMLLIKAVERQIPLENLCSTDGMGVTLKALKSRLYRLGFVYRGGSWSKKEVA